MWPRAASLFAKPSHRGKVEEEAWQQWQHLTFARVRSAFGAALAFRSTMGVHRTGANGRERSPPFAMQKVVGSSPIIRFKNPVEAAFHLPTLLTSRVCRP